MKINLPINNRGQSLVELALLLPAMLLLTVFTLDMGRGVYYSSAIYNAAREAARFGIIHPNDVDGIKDAAINLAVGLDLHRNDITVSPDPPDLNATKINVIIRYDFKLVTPIARYFIKNSCGCIELHSSSTMLIER
jgi:hypothetical protein